MSPACTRPNSRVERDGIDTELGGIADRGCVQGRHSGRP